MPVADHEATRSRPAGAGCGRHGSVSSARARWWALSTGGLVHGRPGTLATGILWTGLPLPVAMVHHLRVRPPTRPDDLGGRVGEDSRRSARRLTPPSWLDLRLVLGVLLVLVAVVVGARVFTDADKSVRVWALARDVPAGGRIGPGDLMSVRVRLYDNASAYVSAGTSLDGRRVARELRSGDLLPASALSGTGADATVVPLSASDQAVPPGLHRGDRVDVYASGTKDAAGTQTTYRVLSAVVIESVDYGGQGALTAGRGIIRLTVDLPPGCAARSIPRLSGQTLFVVTRRHAPAVDACADAAAWPATATATPR